MEGATIDSLCGGNRTEQPAVFILLRWFLFVPKTKILISWSKNLQYGELLEWLYLRLAFFYKICPPLSPFSHSIHFCITLVHTRKRVAIDPAHTPLFSCRSQLQAWSAALCSVTELHSMFFPSLWLNATMQLQGGGILFICYR